MLCLVITVLQSHTPQFQLRVPYDKTQNQETDRTFLVGLHDLDPDCRQSKGDKVVAWIVLANARSHFGHYRESV